MGRPNQIAIVCSAELLSWLEKERKRLEAMVRLPIPLSRVVVSILEAVRKEP